MRIAAGLLAITVGLGACHFALLRSDAFVDVDDHLLVDPMAKIATLADYLAARRELRIQDFEPVRDFSYWLNLLIRDRWGIGSFHATNVALWALCAFVAFLLMSELLVARLPAAIMTALITLHPACNAAVAWVSARKHLLAAFFALLATLLLVRERRRGKSGAMKLRTALAVSCLYALACFSQPISLLWPAWAAWFWFAGERDQRPRVRGGELVAFGLMAVVGLTCAACNLRFYSADYLAQNAASKYVEGAWNPTGVKLLAVGRYLFDVIVPGWIAIPDHYPGSVQNLIGLGLVPIASWLLFKSLGARLALTWALLVPIWLAPVTLRLTNIFCSDTYLLVPVVALFVAVALAFARMQIPARAGRALVGIAVIVAFAFAWKTHSVSVSFLSSRSLWESGYATEPTPRNTVRHALYLLDDGRVDEALALGEQVFAWQPSRRNFLPLLLAKGIVLKPGVSPLEKIRFLEAKGLYSPWFNYYLARLYAGEGQFDRADSLLRGQFQADPVWFVRTVQDDVEVVTAEMVFFCARASSTACTDLAPQVRGHLLFHEWREDLYLARSAQLAGGAVK